MITDWLTQQLSLWVAPGGSGLILFLAVFMVWPMWVVLIYLGGGGLYDTLRAIGIFNLLAGIGGFALAVFGIGPFPAMFGDALALLGLGLVGLFIARFVY